MKKRYQINILGRHYTMVTDKDEMFVRSIEAEINKQLNLLKVSMPHADNLDLSILYLFLLSEKIDILQDSVEQIRELSQQAKHKLALLRKEIEQHLL